MGKIKVSISAALMFLAALLAGRSDIFLIYGVSAIMHEMGHLLAARLRGIKIREVQIGVSGARICTQEQMSSYADEFILCMSGPLVNAAVLVLGALFLAYRNIDEQSMALALRDFAFGGKVMSLLFNMLSRLVIAFLSRSKHLLIS